MCCTFGVEIMRTALLAGKQRKFVAAAALKEPIRHTILLLIVPSFIVITKVNILSTHSSSLNRISTARSAKEFYGILKSRNSKTSLRMLLICRHSISSGKPSLDTAYAWIFQNSFFCFRCPNPSAWIKDQVESVLDELETFRASSSEAPRDSKWKCSK